MTPRTLVLSLCLLLLLIGGMSASLLAQSFDPTPFPIQPGVPLVTSTPTRDPAVCDTPLPVRMGQTIYIKPGVNIRAQPSESSAIMWNTVYDNTDERGQLNDRIFNIAARVVEGPVCNGGLNWWRVTGLRGNGWVGEGRRDLGFYIIVPGADTACNSIYTLQPGKLANLLFNVKVHEDRSLTSRVKTVAPAGTPVFILGGGECVNGYKWWNVRVTVVNVLYEGWMVESDGSDLFLIPSDLPNLEDGTLCGPPLNLIIGQEAVVNTGGVGEAIALRAAPGKGAPLLYSLVDNVPLVIEGAPVCKENLNWWQVRVLASQPVVGWMAEGSQGVGYWIVVRRPGEFRYDPSLPDATATGGAPLPDAPPQQRP
jgi:hypothetical protein